MRNKLTLLATITLAVVATLAPLVPSAIAQDKPAPAKPTLYQRIGGYDNIAAIVGEFLKQLGQDKAFDRFGQGRGKNSLERARQLIVDQVCNMTGGPCLYIGRDMKTAHTGLNITQAEWEAAGNHLKSAMTKYKVGEAEQKEVLDLIGGLRPDIVEKPAAAQNGMDSKAKSN